MARRKMRIALGVTGCIGAYKAAEILRGLQQRGASVRVAMTRHACEFVQPLTFQALSGEAVITDMFAAREQSDIQHITIAQEIDLLLVAPATANILAKFANGIADDFLTTLYISTPAPMLVAPAMNVEMWNHPATQANVATLRNRGVSFVDPEAGYLACGMEGSGRLAEVDRIVESALNIVIARREEPKRDLAGEHVLVTAGPTIEDIDPVRFISNRSSGKMGYAIAAAAAKRGARVTLISGPVKIAPPADVEVIPVRSTAEMFNAVLDRFEKATIIIKAAAVADYRPMNQATEKIKKNDGRLTIELEKTEDILSELGLRKGNRILIGFAAET
ncbi:MAG TPA: bifunctional phosphopantothenoylcysteine decarboxylase/phosphopantothenate--cysteine ligase CoaBC, partial [Blastocatellia bacterium]|nr:bifunctional phosphopantothenoylcysteine decarboxylase/phosphopantothenate--cysteine ligase CoaBC [Blastocatellia bacterium]